MACPFFLPQERIENPPWPHPSRLPLGDGWTGHCTAPGHEGAQPSDEELREGCNLGYARACPRLPRERSCDALRFSLARDRDRKLTVQFVCEIAHAPAQHGMLEFDAATGRWSSTHADTRIQKMAECYVGSYLRRASDDGESSVASRQSSARTASEAPVGNIEPSATASAIKA